MADLQARIMSAAIAGGFIVAADYALSEFASKQYGQIENKQLKLFALGFSGSLLQQYVAPMLLR